MLKIYIDETVLQTGHAIRGIGAYTRGIKEGMQQCVGVSLVKDKLKAEVVFYPYFDLFFDTLKINKKEKVAVMVHDVIPLMYPKHYPAGIRGKLNFFKQKQNLKRVAVVLCDSEASKKDIVRYLDIEADKIFVTHLAPNSNIKMVGDKRKLESIRRKYSLPEKFVLYVGDINYNKNIVSLVRACIELNTCLVIVGKQASIEKFDRLHPENQDLRVLIDEYGEKPLIKRLGFVPDEDLSAIFSLATLYSQPSYYEGFGLPVLEAMATGCPVVCSKIQALSEIANGAAAYFNPNEVKDIKAVLEIYLNDKKLLAGLSSKGIVHVKNFSWKKTAEKTINAIKECI